MRRRFALARCAEAISVLHAMGNEGMTAPRDRADEYLPTLTEILDKRGGRRDLVLRSEILLSMDSMIAIDQIDDASLLWQYSPLLRGALHTLGYLIEHGPIQLTLGKALKRKFVQWAAETFDWPGYTAGDLFAVNKVLNEADFPPLVILHDLLVSTKLARHHKGCLVITKEGRVMARAPQQLWLLLTGFFLWETDHGHYMRQRYAFEADWPQILDVINEAVHEGAEEDEICAALLGLSLADARRDYVTCMVIYMFVLRPLSWAGLLNEVISGKGPSIERIFVKTPLWSAAWRLPSDDLLASVRVH